MRIAQSSIEMTSMRQYRQSGINGDRSPKKDFFETAQDAEAGSVSKSDDLSSVSRPRANSFQNSILGLLIQRLMSKISGGGTRQMVTYSEYEYTEFHAKGSALTEDGRSIDFSVDIMMSRSYMEYVNVPAYSMQNALCDPLIVNVGAGTADIRDQKFFFDLDTDGKEDEISMPGRGSGFLALDLNEDGVINDGSELFGTKSGDGFADLSKYDSDGNGWIDENDTIFEKLKVWCKGDNGEDILMSLKEADIGAIYLGSQATDFTLMGMDGIRDGVIRSTGLFIRESLNGGVGTIQHVDMAMESRLVFHTDEAMIEKLFDESYHVPELKISEPDDTLERLTVNETESDKKDSTSAAKEREAEERVNRRHRSERLLKEAQEKRRKNKLLEQEQFEKKLYQERAQQKAWKRRKAMREYLQNDAPQNLTDTVSYA